MAHLHTKVRLFLLFVTAAILIACGGGGSHSGSGSGGSTSGSSSGSSAGSTSGSTSGGGSSLATFQIVWPSRSRAALVSPLTSALSARITLSGAGTDGSDVISVANRDQTKLASYTGTYTLSKAIVSGSGIATIGFYSQADAGGTVVGTASGTVNADTTVELGTVVVTGTVASVAVADTTVALGSGTTQLLFSAKDASGNLVAVTPGSAVWSLTSGSDKLSLSADGIVTPGATGTAKLHATVDGIASPDATITVTPAAPAVGTVRLQNGPILEVVGTCAQAIQGSTNTLQTFKITKSDGTTETVSNTLVADDMGVNDPVILLRQGTQPLQATFSDSNHLFYDLSNYTYKVPITAGGVFTVNVAMKTTDNISTESACTVGGLQVDSFTLQSPYSGLAPRIMIPLAYVLDVPLAGQPLNHLSGSVQYDSIYALRRFDVYVNYSSSNDYSNSQSLDAAGALSFSNASGSSNLAQGGVRVTLNME